MPNSDSGALATHERLSIDERERVDAVYPTTIVLAMCDERTMGELTTGILRGGGVSFVTVGDTQAVCARKPGGWVIGTSPDAERAAETTRAIRASWPDLPILGVDAADADHASLMLTAGADDVISRTDLHDIVTARLSAFGRRVRAERVRDCIQVGDLLVDRRRQMVWCDGRALRTTNREFRILECLVVNAGSAVDRRTLLDFMWVYRGSARPSVNALHYQIRNLRRLMRCSATVSIQTVSGRGYSLVGPIGRGSSP